MRSCPVRAFAFLCFLSAVMWAGPAAAQEQDGDVFLVISLSTPTFDTTFNDDGDYLDPGSETIIVRIGALTGGAPDPLQTRFEGGETPPTIPLPPGEEEEPFDLTTLNGHQSTIFGSFEAQPYEGDPVPHMVTPTATDVDPLIQAAVFASSADLAAAASANAFLTTRDIAEFVYEKLLDLDEGTELTLDDVARAIFDTGVELGATADTCEADGALFPHDPEEENPLFRFEISFDDQGTLDEFDVCLLVGVDVREGSINLKKKGQLPVAILSSDTFDASEFDDATVKVVGLVGGEKVTLEASKTGVEDVNEDGLDDLVVHFSVPDLADLDLLTPDSTTLTVQAEDPDSGCIQGTSSVTILKKK